MDNVAEKYLPFLQKHWLSVLLGVFGLMFLSIGLISLLGSKDNKDDISFEEAEHQSAPGSAKLKEKEKITVDVEGAVERPGVYNLPSDSRIQDALIAAGGMNEKADRDRISKGLNLASKLTDGAKIYIPYLGDPIVSLGTVGGGDNVLGSASNLININSASASELDKLSGVGPVTAEKIISNRPYGDVSDLVSKKVVSQKVFDGIKDQISIY